MGGHATYQGKTMMHDNGPRTIEKGPLNKSKLIISLFFIYLGLSTSDTVESSLHER